MYGRLAIVCWLLVTSSASAIVTRDDIVNSIGILDDTAYKNLGNQYPAAVWISAAGFGSGTLVAPDWVLTAAHVVADANGNLLPQVDWPFVEIGNGPDYPLGQFTTASVGVRNIVIRNGWGGPNSRDGRDIALVQLSSPVMVTPMFRNSGTVNSLLGQNVDIVGYGLTGTGATGSTISDHEKRGEKNVIDVRGPVENPNFDSDIVLSDFDCPNGNCNQWNDSSATPRALEGSTAPGDSGGPWIVGGRLAAVTSFGQCVTDANGECAVPRIHGRYGFYHAATAVSPHNIWINGTMGGVNWNSRGSEQFDNRHAWGDEQVPNSNDDVRFSVVDSGNDVPVVEFNDDFTVRDIVVEFGPHEFQIGTHNFRASREVVVHDGGKMILNGGTLEADNSVTISGVNSRLVVVSGGELEASTLSIEDQAIVTAAGLLDVGTISIGGALHLGNHERIPNGSAVTISAVGTFDLKTFSETIGSLSGAGDVALDGGALTTGGNNGSTTHSGEIKGTGSLTKSGLGTFTLAGPNTYSGNTTILNGALHLGNNERIHNSSAVFIAAVGTFDLKTFSETIGSLSGAGDVALDGGTLTTGGNNGSTTHSGEIKGTGNLTKTGLGTFTLDGPNTYSGNTTIVNGALHLGNNERIPNNSAVTISAVGTFDLKTFSETIGSLSGAGDVGLGGGTLTTGGNNGSTTHSGEIKGTGNLTKTGLGTFTLAGPNTYSGNTTILNGALHLGNNERIPNSSAVTISAVGTFDLKTFSETIGSISGAGDVGLGGGTLTTGGNNGSTTHSGEIKGTGNLTKTGLGTFTLAGANTYSGVTRISGGVLLANNATGSATGSGAVIVDNFGTLGGTGIIAGAVTNSGILSPGASIGVLNITGNYTQAIDGEMLIELASPSSFDQLVIGGGATLAGILNIDFLAGFMPVPGNAFNIVGWGSRTGIFDTLLLPALNPGLMWNVSELYTNGEISVAVAALPGDYNHDGTVDAADYVVWRKNGGTQEQFNVWRSNFGQTVGGGSSANTGVPEPATFLMLIVAVLAKLIGPS